MYQKYGKRLIDILLSGCGIVLLSPVYLILAVAIKVDDPGPVMFRQKRVGIHKSHFHIMKFRTMKMDTPKDTPTHLLENPHLLGVSWSLVLFRPSPVCRRPTRVKEGNLLPSKSTHLMIIAIKNALTETPKGDHIYPRGY